MSDDIKDARRALDASKAIVDGRWPTDNMPSIMVTLEHVVATVLLATCDCDARKAAGLLNEGLVPRVEERIALYASRKQGGAS
ncbi:hypothetical protein [Martelella sp. FOR1707]